MINRRQWLGITGGVGAALALDPRLLSALRQGQLITRAVPSTGERLPIIGLGSSATFAAVARSQDYSALRDVFRVMTEKGGTVFDTAPGYGASEQVAGDIAAELGITERVFWATKMNVSRGGPADPTQAREQVETSLKRLRKKPVDLIQVHGPVEMPTQLGVLNEFKKAGRVRYVGVTSTSKPQYQEMERLMRTEPLDFIGIDYAIDNRSVEERILPTAAERGIGVVIYLPFGRTRLWKRVAGRQVPEWAKEFDATSWAQFFLKFVAADPRVTVITPATSRAGNMADNLGAAVGRLPDDAMRKRMVAFIDGLPE